MLNATRDKKGLGVRRTRNPIVAYGPFKINRTIGADGKVSLSLSDIPEKVKKQKQYPLGKY